jgi:hypothetical protein
MGRTVLRLMTRAEEATFASSIGVHPEESLHALYRSLKKRFGIFKTLSYSDVVTQRSGHFLQGYRVRV